MKETVRETGGRQKDRARLTWTSSHREEWDHEGIADDCHKVLARNGLSLFVR